MTRGVLIDIPRLRGVPWLEPGTPIYIEDLEAWEAQAGVRVSAGDALFVRTGVWARRAAEGPWLRGRSPGGRSAGLHPSVIPWLKERDIALMGSDHPTYVAPSELPGAVHDFALLYLGVHMFDNCDLEALAEAAAERNRWEFLLMAAPLPIRGGTGSPLNPIEPGPAPGAPAGAAARRRVGSRKTCSERDQSLIRAQRMVPCTSRPWSSMAAGGCSARCVSVRS